MVPVRRIVVVFAFVLALVPSSQADAQSRTCSAIQQNFYVRDVMSDLYLWNKEIPDADPTRYTSPAAYLEAIRFRPIDETFSYITDRAANDALFGNSEYVGFGFSSVSQDAELRVTQVFPGSAAEDAGLARGDRIVEIDGRTVADIVAAGESAGAFGPAQAGVAADIVFVRGDERLDARMVKRPVIIPTVSNTQVIDLAGRKVGYIFFRNFVEPSTAALDQAFAELRRQGASELVLDLRYNGGGLVSVAQHLGGLIGGTLTTGQVFAEYSHNDRNRSRDRTLRFAAPDNALTLNRVFAITTRASASASELVINALRPFMQVVVIGDRTYGKPVGQYSVPFCDKVLAPVSFALKNANGEGDYFAGLQSTCPAADDLEHQIGDTAETSLHEALVYIETGGCSPRRFDGRTGRRFDVPIARPGGWAALVGAD